MSCSQSITSAPLGLPSTRVLRVIARLNIGGPARHVTVLDHGLRQRGFNTLLAYGDAGAHEGSLEYLLGELGLPAVRVPGLGRDIRPGADLRAFARLLRLIFSLKPDVVHTHTAKAGTLGRLAAAIYNLTRGRARRCAIVHTYHGHVFTGYFGPIGSAVVRTVERALARVTDRLITISSRQRDDIVNCYRIAPLEKTLVVRLGLRLDELGVLPGARERVSGAEQWPADAVVFGFVGRLVHIKDLGTLIHATRLAVDSEPTVRLVLFGDGPQRAEIAQLVHRLGLDAHVLLGGWCHDVNAIYSSIDVAVLSSLNEGTPVALIEAMAAGRSVVATEVGGVRDVVIPEVTGLLVPPREPCRLADAMIRLARSSDLRRDFGVEGRRRALERFGNGRLVSEIISVYRECLTAKRGLKESPAFPLVQ